MTNTEKIRTAVTEGESISSQTDKKQGKFPGCRRIKKKRNNLKYTRIDINNKREFSWKRKKNQSER